MSLVYIIKLWLPQNTDVNRLRGLNPPWLATVIPPKINSRFK